MSDEQPVKMKLSNLKRIRVDTDWEVDDLEPIEPYADSGVIPNSQILKDYTMTSAWVESTLIKTGFNTRKTTRKGVRRMRNSIKTSGFVPTNAVVIVPVEVIGEEKDKLFQFSQEDLQSGLKFQCADGMHRVRCVTELTEEKKAGAAGSEDIKCSDEVFAIILRPDIPRKYLIQLSLSKSFHSSMCTIIM